MAATDLLLPTPQHLQRTGGLATLNGPVIHVQGWDLLGPLNAPIRGIALAPSADAPVRLSLNPDLPEGPEAYHLRIQADAAGTAVVHAAAPTPRGLRHALATLAQLLHQHGPTLPCLDIEDAPTFPIRGVMLDISRCKVPTMETLRDTVDLLASLKYNHIQFYTEHAFAYAGHEDVWRDVSPITPDEARELDRFCAARGVELCPNQNCFGHLAEWLRLPRYAPLAETHGTWKFMHFDRSGPFSLCPSDPGSIELVRDLLGQLLPCFTSSRVNIGCDETFDVGQGRSREEVERRGRAAVYLDFVRKIAAVAREHGKRPAMWADIALSHPEALADMPDGVIGLAWGYEPDADFAAWCQRLNEHGIEPWVCPGTSSWRSITGRTSERRENISRAAEAGAAHGAAGILICDWGDTGHHQHWPIALIGLAHGAEAAWNAAAARTFDPGAAVHALERRLPAGSSALPASPLHQIAALGPWLESLGDLDAHLRRDLKIRNASAIFNDLYRCYGAAAIPARAQTFRDMADRLETLGPPPGLTSGSLMQRELAHTLSTLRLALEWGALVRADSPPDASTRRDIAARLRAIIDEHRDLWLQRNRIGGLEKSCSYFTPVLERIEHADADTLRWEHPTEPRPSGSGSLPRASTRQA